MKIPTALITARKAAGLSQAQLAKKLGLSAGTVGGWETGRNGIRDKHKRKVCELLDVPLAELVD